MKILVKRDSSNYIAAATNKNYTPEQIEFIIEHGNDGTLFNLIEETQDEDIMAELLDHGCSASVRQYIAMYTNDIDKIYTLLRDKSKYVKRWIYRRISSNGLDANIIETLASDSNYKIREIVAENTSDPAILRQLAQDSNVKVRYGVVDNGHISNNIDVLEILVHDEDSYIRRRISKYAYKYPELLNILLADSDEDVVEDALVWAPDDIKRQYLDIDNAEARYNIARFTEDPEILDILSYDSSAYVRIAVAKNKHTPIDVLDRLALSESGDSDVLSNVLGTHNVSVDVVLTLAKSDDRKVRYRVALWCDDKKYRNALEILAEDPDDRVREEAQRNLHWM